MHLNHIHILNKEKENFKLIINHHNEFSMIVLKDLIIFQFIINLLSDGSEILDFKNKT